MIHATNETLLNAGVIGHDRIQRPTRDSQPRPRQLDLNLTLSDPNRGRMHRRGACGAHGIEDFQLIEQVDGSW
jgi:hypothetical protein